MICRLLCCFAPLLLTAGCTSVKVNRLATEKYRKNPVETIRQVTADDAGRRANTKVATIDMRTRSPFAADLNALARKRTAALGGNAYVVTAGDSRTTVSGGPMSVLGDSTSSSMSLEVIRWQDQPVEEEKPKAKRRWWLF